MLSFCEMLNLLESGRSADDIIDAAWKRKMASPKAVSYRGREQLHKAIPDYGKEFDPPAVGKGHWIGNEEPDMSLKDITGPGGKQDVSARPNPTKPQLQVKQSVGYNSRENEWEKMLDDKLDFIATIEDTTPEHVKKHIIALLKWNQELRKQPISPKLVNKTFEIDDMILSILEKDDERSSQAPKELPMAKYMLRKHSNVF